MPRPSQEEIDAIQIIQDYSKSQGEFFFTNDNQKDAFDIALDFGKIALSVRGTDTPKYGETPEEEQYFEKIADASLQIGTLLFKRIPVAAMVGLERAGRGAFAPAETLKPKAENPVGHNLAKTFANNIGGPLSYMDLAMQIFPDDKSPNVYSRIVNALRSNRKLIDENLSRQGLVLTRTKVTRAHNGRPRAVLAFMAVTKEQSERDEITSQTESAWSVHERENKEIAKYQKRAFNWKIYAWYRDQEIKSVPKYIWQREAREISHYVRDVERQQILEREQSIEKKERIEAASKIEARQIIPGFLEATKPIVKFDFYSKLSGEEIEFLVQVATGAVKEDLQSINHLSEAEVNDMASNLLQKMGLAEEIKDARMLVFDDRLPVPARLARSLWEVSRQSEPASAETKKSDNIKHNPEAGKGMKNASPESLGTLRSPRLEKDVEMGKPTDQWHGNFEGKFKEAYGLAGKIVVDDAGRERLARILEGEGLIAVNGDDPNQDRKNVAVALLLKKPSTRRLLVSEQTSTTAMGIIKSFVPAEEK